MLLSLSSVDPTINHPSQSSSRPSFPILAKLRQTLHALDFLLASHTRETSEYVFPRCPLLSRVPRRSPPSVIPRTILPASSRGRLRPRLSSSIPAPLDSVLIEHRQDVDQVWRCLLKLERRLGYGWLTCVALQSANPHRQGDRARHRARVQGPSRQPPAYEGAISSQVGIRSRRSRRRSRRRRASRPSSSVSSTAASRCTGIPL